MRLPSDPELVFPCQYSHILPWIRHLRILFNSPAHWQVQFCPSLILLAPQSISLHGWYLVPGPTFVQSSSIFSFSFLCLRIYLFTVLNSLLVRVQSLTASQCLRDSISSPSGAVGGAISTGLPRLDAALVLPRPGQEWPSTGPRATDSDPGLRRGHVTEVWGPSGVGKTTFA